MLDGRVRRFAVMQRALMCLLLFLVVVQSCR